MIEADYRDRPEIAGGFENIVLYRMCQDHPHHDNPYVTRGKILLIGRAYSASPARGAGTAAIEDQSDLFQCIADKLKTSDIDHVISALPFGVRFSKALMTQVVDAHKFLNDLISSAIHDRSKGNSKSSNRNSFCSKYLHFHRPNAFPISDNFVKIALGELTDGPAIIPPGKEEYDMVCRRFLSYVECRDEVDDWTPRSIDTLLVQEGRAILEGRVK